MNDPFPSLPQDSSAARVSAGAVFLAFLQLGLTSFGGPIAHLGYFHDAFVVRRRWIEARAYADLVALCQFLPGPASSQVGIGIGLAKAGLPGAVAAWLGFTLPSAAALIAFGYGVTRIGHGVPAGVLHGLMVVAVAVVAQAVWSLARSLCPDRPRATLAGVAALGALALPTPLMQVAIIAAGGAIGALVLRGAPDADGASLEVRVGRRVAVAALALFVVLLAGLPLLAAADLWPGFAVIDRFYRSGALVFGGGHVVLPLLRSATVLPGWVSDDAFLAGYGAAQAVPGPLFSFAAYLGTVMTAPPQGWRGGLLALAAIYAPSFLLVIGTLPFWEDVRRVASVRRALAGVNAAVVGLLVAALYTPVWTSAILSRADFALALAAFLGLTVWSAPPWLVVLLTAAGAWALALTS